MKDVRDALFVAQRSDGTLVRRPLSPHLQVYRFQLSMFLSIANRIAGVAASFGTLLLVWWLVAAATGPVSFATVQSVVGSPIGILAMFGWTLALVYHFVAGLRHLAWDAGYGFDKTSFNKVGPIAVAVTLILTVLVFAIGVSLWNSAPVIAVVPVVAPAGN
ncbi:succinate dehydrogenase, cytochrome b556 subunit [Acetobacteraceae bacterium KSS8]|uniref:Succinate dehydrogenase cytochrome b556 subunit n=1 Tax=Endosaccharibacter trunci TaxID=2812733 RepID=A0ABT1W9W2_9PROT|nr:succinate dehydrogenase, cytochrome b556 subunit [Acetobacteraceae bacterium KSS8]